MMLPKSWRGAWRKVIAASFAGATFAWTATSVFAQDADTQAQIRELQKQVQELQRLLANQNQIAPAGGSSPAAVDSKAVEKIVGDYLKRDKEDSKKKEEAKKKEDEAKGHEVGASLGMTARWNHGPWLESSDKAFKVHLGGRTQFDIASVWAQDNVMFGGGGIGAFDDAVNFRRARLAVEGTAWEVINFNFEYDFLNTFDAGAPAGVGNRRNFVENTPVPTDLWMEITHLPWLGNLRIGNHKPWISFEHLTSSRFLNFLERSYQFDSFIENGNNGFSPGISIWNYTEDESFAWQVGVFKNTRSIFGWNVGDGEWMGNARVIGTPFYQNEGREFVYIGLGAYAGDTDDDTVRYRSRTMIRNGPAPLHNIAAISQFTADSQFVFSPELVIQYGPWILQAEYVGAYTDGVTAIARTSGKSTATPNGRNYYAQGAYAEVLYFLTGEHRDLDRKLGRFNRVVPFRNYFFVPGEGCSNIFSSGAWQVAGRYSWLDLDNNGIKGGQIHSMTLGLNWFLNPNFKIQWNYEYAHRQIFAQPSTGNYQGAGVRFSFDF